MIPFTSDPLHLQTHVSGPYWHKHTHMRTHASRCPLATKAAQIRMAPRRRHNFTALQPCDMPPPIPLTNATPRFHTHVSLPPLAWNIFAPPHATSEPGPPRTQNLDLLPTPLLYWTAPESCSATFAKILTAGLKRLPPKFTCELSKNSVSRASKSYTASLQNKRFARDFVQEKFKPRKRAFRTTRPP